VMIRTPGACNLRLGRGWRTHPAPGAHLKLPPGPGVTCVLGANIALLSAGVILTQNHERRRHAGKKGSKPKWSPSPPEASTGS
jgi:hypothetical protein